MKNAITELTVLPFSPTIFRYSINNSETLHAIQTEKLIKMLTELCPKSLLKSLNFIDRKIPFYIDIKENEVFELVSDPENIQNNFEKIIRDELNSPITINKNTKKLANCQLNFWRK
jgi:hypothetical protein